MMEANASGKRQEARSSPNPYLYTLDVLTDGSEGTGDGTLFLSVWKKSKLANVDDDLNKDPQMIEQLATGVPRARYAVTGLGDLTSRLATDQRFKLQTVKAVFCSTAAGVWGLPALLIALHQAGAAELSIVSTQSDKIEKMIDLLEMRRKNPVVRLCQVPDEHCGSDYWWQVYRDEYLLVHAKQWKQNMDCQDRVVYLYTLLHHERANSILVLPPECEPSNELTSQLPIIDGDNSQVQLLLGVSLRSSGSWISSVKTDSCPWYFTDPSESTFDSGILVRAQQQSQLWSEQSPAFFPWKSTRESSTPSNERRLRSNKSLILSTTEEKEIVKIDRSLLFRSEPFESDRTSWPKLLMDFLSGPSSEFKDDNEIDLEEENEVELNHFSGPLLVNPANLLVLGTGCASPSPYRGASGYALFLPNDFAIAIEAGEGFVTQWNRYAGGCSLSTIRMIWISHAHWDHYGGLASLLITIKSTCATSRNADQPSEKRIRSQKVPPWVMAPRKVLKYLELTLNEPSSLFRAVPHEDPSAIPQVFDDLNALPGHKQIIFWENVLVDHSCRSAYGFVMGLHLGEGSPLVFGFSGDTRPCWRFVQACRKVSVICGVGRINFLVHEATFDENEKKMSIEKKHSTVLEASQVAKDANAERVLLTHFSQRYDSVPDIDPKLRRRVGFALDGMLVPLRR